MKRAATSFLFTLCYLPGFSQSQQVDVTAAFRNNQATVSFSFGYDWHIGKKKKFSVGSGLRFTSYFGTNQYYQTAPAKLTSGNVGPQVLFVDNYNENIDSLLISSSQNNSINLLINLSYRLNSKFLIGFNIDAVGFSFGTTKEGSYIHNGQSAIVSAHPTLFNVLLVSDNDQGSLNSELYVNYFLTEKWGVKLAGQFLFTEYTTQYEIQQYPEANDRFRNKSLLLAIGIIRKF